MRISPAAKMPGREVAYEVLSSASPSASGRYVSAPTNPIAMSTSVAGCLRIVDSICFGTRPRSVVTHSTCAVSIAVTPSVSSPMMETAVISNVRGSLP